MKNKIIGLLSCMMAVLPQAVTYAQADDLLVYHSMMQTTRTVATPTADVSSYKNYVGVYVRAKVMRTFLDVFPQATHMDWHLADNQYLASFEQNGQLCKALFDVQGKLRYALQYGMEKNLPRAVRRQVHLAYLDYHITAVTKVEMNGAKVWVINLQNADQLIVVQVQDSALDELYNYKTH